MDCLRPLAAFSFLAVAACNGASPPPVGPPAPAVSPVGPPVVEAAPPAPVASAPASAPPLDPPPAATAPVAPRPLTMPSAADVQAAGALRCSKRTTGHGCVDKEGKVVVPFDQPQPVVFKKSGLALVLSAVKGFVLVDVRNQVVLEVFNFDNGPDPLAFGRSRVVWQAKTGFVDSEWRLVIPPRFDAAFAFEKGKAKVCTGCDPDVWSKDRRPGARDGRVFFVDADGKEVAEK